ncbi:MAG: glycosyltransferase, partial [Betaproteobacteria bacterium]
FSNITRPPSRIKYKAVSWNHTKKPRAGVKYLEFIDEMLQQHALVELAIEWTKRNRFDIVIVGIGWSAPWWLHAREYFLAVKAMGVPVGLFHYDNDLITERMLVQTYFKTRDWELAAELVSDSITEGNKEELAEDSFDLALYTAISSPLLLRPDFVITCSDWVGRFIDPLETTNKFTMHPLLQLDTDQDLNHLDKKYEKTDVLMVNPQHRKNPELMLKLIDHNPHLSFRILRGGWDKDPMRKLRPKLKQMEAYKNGQVEIVKYSASMADLYQASRLLFFPSYTEGYGQTAVEPMLFDIPVVASSYPAIKEATGDTYPSLCPYLNSIEEWSNLVGDALSNESIWQEKSRQRRQELQLREKKEGRLLQKFLEQQTN